MSLFCDSQGVCIILVEIVGHSTKFLFHAEVGKSNATFIRHEDIRFSHEQGSKNGKSRRLISL